MPDNPESLLSKPGQPGGVPSMAALYQSLADLSHIMLDAAQRGDWDEVTSLEAACAQLVEQLRQRPIEACPPGERDTCMQFIHEILANDAATRDLAQPWMKELEQILRPRRSHFPAYSFR